MDRTLAAARDAFPSPLKADAATVAESLTIGSLPVSPDSFPVFVEGETVFIPVRVYLDEVTLRSPYSTNQLAILDCLQTRHHDGFVRERALRRVITLNTPWSAPFVVKLTSEYVIEILDLIEANWAQIDGLLMGRFLAENPSFRVLVRQRMISYWNAYYRDRFFTQASYVGFKLMDRLDQMTALAVEPDVQADRV